MVNTRGAAKFVSSLSLDSTPPNVVKHAKLCVMDAVGVMLGGLDTKSARIAREEVSQWPTKEGVTLFGSKERVSPPQAAFANCIAASVLDMDDGHNLGGHPGGVVVPAVLAAAEAKGVSGKKYLEGVVTGYEIAVRAMEALVSRESGGSVAFPATGEPYHSTGTGAAYGAAAGAAKVLGASEEQTAQAVKVASAHTPSTRPYQIQTLGHNAKECLGWAGITGVEAAYLAIRGFTGPNTLFDTDGARGTSVDTIGSTFEIVNNYFKAYPSCRYTHAPLDSLLALIKQHSLKADNIAKVEVHLKKRHAALNSPKPATIEQAQYSHPFVLGAVLAYGHHGPDTMDEAKHKDAANLKQAQKVVLVPDYPQEKNRWPAVVVVHTSDGKRYEKEVAIPRGDPQNPLSEADLTAKFMTLATPALGKKDADEVLAMIQSLEKLADIRDLSALLNKAVKQPVAR